MRITRFRRPRQHRLWLTRSATAVLLSALTAALAACAPYPVPSANEMAATYKEHAAAFTQIANWAKTDGDFALEAGADGPLSGQLAPTREAAYRRLMDDVGAKRIEAHDSDLGILFGSEGLSVSGVEWGYYYSVSGPLSEEDSGYESTPVGNGWFGYVYRF